ncbi:hypothetical protein [Candidatus Hydrogenosomobacter endosymbioticus]|nr:hypothetical protein [Candidatus Hydrogenosomobacter endosymbioticus]
MNRECDECIGGGVGSVRYYIVILSFFYLNIGFTLDLFRSVIDVV